MSTATAESTIYNLGTSGHHSRWLSIKDIADDLSISMSTAYKWSARREPYFPRAIRLRNGDVRVRRDWYESWLKDLEGR